MGRESVPVSRRDLLIALGAGSVTLAGDFVRTRTTVVGDECEPVTVCTPTGYGDCGYGEGPFGGTDPSADLLGYSEGGYGTGGYGG